MPLPKQEKKEKKNLVIVTMALPKMKKKINGIMAISLPKMGGKKKFVAEIWEEILKKKYYIHNIFIILSQQITGDQLLLVQI